MDRGVRKMREKEKMLELIKKKQSGGRVKKWMNLKMIVAIWVKDRKFLTSSRLGYLKGTLHLEGAFFSYLYFRKHKGFE